jgi:cell division transport system permease protein
MQLVGARRWFILKPFLIRAGGYGLLAGVIAAVLLVGMTRYAQREIEDLSLLHNQTEFMALVLMLLVIGATITIISTFFSINRYLRMSLDQLY